MYVYMIPGGSTFGQICLVSGLLFLPFYLIGKKKKERKQRELERIEKERRIEEERRNRMMEEAARRAQITAEIHALERQEAQKKADARRKKEAEERKFYSELRSRYNL